MHQGRSRELETERTREYVSISIRGTTQPLGLRWGFETTSKKGKGLCIMERTLSIVKPDGVSRGIIGEVI